MILADTNLSLAPAWPLGLPTLLAAAGLLVILTVWTYLGVKNATARRITLVLVLRLAALAVALGMIMRPSFAFTELEGVELTKLLVIVDSSESMSVAETDGLPSRWEQVAKIWTSREVQRRLDRLRTEQKIEVVKYLGAEDLRPDDPNAAPTGKRTDVGAWLHHLRQRHGHEKHLRGILVLSDGADNGLRFSAAEQARLWRGVAPIHAYGVGDPANPKFRKDIGLTSLDVKEKPVSAKSKMTVNAVMQAPGFDKADVEVQLLIEEASGKNSKKLATLPKFRISQDKDQPVKILCDAPEEPGEYKLTLRVTPHPDESNKENNEISTFVQVIKEQINVLWVDRPRVYEPTYAIRYALAREPRFKVYHVVAPSVPALGQAEPKKGDPLAFYQFDKRHYDVIVIGDVSAAQFSLSDSSIFSKVKQMVIEKKTGLLMLGGTETFGKGGWQETALADLLPTTFDAKAEFSRAEVRALRVKGAPDLPFLRLEPEATKNDTLWNKEFEEFEGYAPLGTLTKDSTKLLEGRNGELLMAAKRNAAEGYVVAFAADSTWSAWRGSPAAVAGYAKFWKQLIFWLSKQEDQANQLVLQLDKRRLNANAGDVLGFTFHLRGKDGKALVGATFKTKIIAQSGAEYGVTHARDDQQQRGAFQGARTPGAHRLVVEGKDGDVEARAEASFLVAFDDIELLRPLAEHETLQRLAAASEGRFQVLDEASLLQYLDELQSQVNREARHKTTHWPDWTRLPASDHPRDQLAGLWNSFALVGLLAFATLIGCEWLLRRLWGLV